MRLHAPLLALFLIAWSGAAFAAADPADYMPVELIAESRSPEPGSTILVGFRMKPKPGWHGYWSNPGDAGFAPSVRWSAPAGVQFGPLLHPAPELISDSGMNSFVHEGQHILLSRMKVPAGLEPGKPIGVKARLNWAACTASKCVPLRGTFSLDLVAGKGEAAAEAKAVRSALRNLPGSAPGGTFARDGSNLVLALPGSLRLDPARLRFFPETGGLVATDGGTGASDDDGVRIRLRATGDPGGSLSGVVSDGRRAYRLTFAETAEEQAAAAEEPAALDQPDDPRPVAAGQQPFDPEMRAARPAEQEKADEGSPSAGWNVAALAAAVAAMVAAATFLLLRRRRG